VVLDEDRLPVWLDSPVGPAAAMPSGPMSTKLKMIMMHIALFPKSLLNAKIRPPDVFFH
jgi:hypothetical protein